MLQLNISPDFTIDDIHKIREYNHEMTKDMTTEEMKKYYKKGADDAQKRIDELRLARKKMQLESDV